MKSKRAFRLLISVLVIICCSRSIPEQREFNKHGISFTIPRGWKIEDEAYIEDEVYYVCIKKTGLVTKGSFSVGCFYEELNIAEKLNSFIESFKSGFLINAMNPKFSEQKRIEFKGNDALKIDITSSIFLAKIVGEIYCFKWCGYTLCLAFFVDEKDEETKDDFKIIKESFQCLKNEEY